MSMRFRSESRVASMPRGRAYAAVWQAHSHAAPQVITCALSLPAEHTARGRRLVLSAETVHVLAPACDCTRGVRLANDLDTGSVTSALTEFATK